MDQDKVIIFEQFARKAKERIEERKKFKKELLDIKSIGMSIDIRGISDAELNEINEFSSDPAENDKYSIFYASKTLQEAAKLMAADGDLQPGKEYQITEMFTAVERRFICDRILSLSGMTGDAGIGVKEMDEVKNS